MKKKQIGLVELDLVLVGAWVVLTIILTAAWYHTDKHAHQLEVNLAAANQQHVQDVRAVANSDLSINNALKAVNEWRQACSVNQRDYQQAQATIVNLAQQLNSKAAQFQQLEKKSHATPLCEQVLTLDVAAVCPDLARGLRQLSAP